MAKRSSLTGKEARRIREGLQLSTNAWAQLLHCSPQSIRNIESGDKAIGEQLGLLMALCQYPSVRLALHALEQKQYPLTDIL